MRIFIIALVFIFLIMPSASYATQADSEKFETAAEAFRQHGDLDSALNMLKKATEADSSNASAYCLMGKVLLEKNLPEKAEKSFLRAIALNKDLCSAYAGRARALLALGKDKDSLAVINQLLSTYPEYSDGYNVRGELYLFVGLYKAAVSDFTIALKKAPMNYSALANRAFGFIKLNNFKSALADIDKILSAYSGVDLGSAGVGHELAWAYYYKGLVHEAENSTTAMADAVKCYNAFLKCRKPPFSDEAVKHAEMVISEMSGTKGDINKSNSSDFVKCNISKVVRQGANAICVELNIVNNSSLPVYSVRADNFDLSLDGELVGRKTAVFLSKDGSPIMPASSGTFYFIIDGITKAFSTWNVKIFEFEINKR